MAAPAWLSQNGVRRITSEFRDISNQVRAGALRQVHDLQFVGDQLTRWRFRLRDFDDGLPGGRQLNQDLQQLGRLHGQDYILMEIQFPDDYPTRPFFLRVVTPRMVWYTGHVTAGGSICIEALTASGSPGAWQAAFTVESILTTVLANMVDCESVEVRTLSGPGGRSGPLRVDLQGRFGYGVMTPYSEAEARSAFPRMDRQHQATGWGAPAPWLPPTTPAGAPPDASSGGTSTPAADGAQEPATDSATVAGAAASDSCLTNMELDYADSDDNDYETASDAEGSEAGSGEEQDDEGGSGSEHDADGLAIRGGSAADSDDGSEMECYGWPVEDAITAAVRDDPDGFRPLTERSLRMYLSTGTLMLTMTATVSNTCLPAAGLPAIYREALGMPNGKPLVIRMRFHSPALGVGRPPFFEITYDVPKLGEEPLPPSIARNAEGAKVVFQFRHVVQRSLADWPKLAEDEAAGTWLPLLRAHLAGRLRTLGNHCVVCDQQQDLPGLKPVPCANPMCVFAFNELGLGCDLAELYSAPPVADLLISMAVAASSTATTMRERLFVNVPFDFIERGRTPSGSAGASAGASPTATPRDAAAHNEALKAAPVVQWDALQKVLTELPATVDMAAAPDLGAFLAERGDARGYRLVRWVLSSSRCHLVQCAPAEAIPEMTDAVQFRLLTGPPDREAAFQALKAQHGSLYAFHGSPFENWHSILRTSLRTMSGTAYQRHGAAFGSGIYLAESICTSAGYSGGGSGWQADDALGLGWANSQLGTTPACIALCEVAKHPDNQARSFGTEPIWIVPRDDCVVTRYLFVWKTASSVPRNVRASSLKIPALALAV